MTPVRRNPIEKIKTVNTCQKRRNKKTITHPIISKNPILTEANNRKKNFEQKAHKTEVKNLEEEKTPS